ncbi:MAG: magnesium chelatase ATPase subunit I [Hyphomicrobium sp.]|nr:magnesium chelatase ATPase subunit I [Hyphomicrobium sp.]
MSIPFPFSAIAGQEQMKLALLIAAIDSTVGGVLVFGDRGTGKSTAVRALASLLPEMDALIGCQYHADPASPCPPQAGCAACAAAASGAVAVTHRMPVPVIDLPLGATEDRVVGALNLEHVLTSGEKVFDPGLLARAHRGFLYIDEVNLLDDHLVDVLLDVAASGENIVERDGISIRHPARFVLVGSGNPEEGELRPQLLDRFGLSVEVKTPDDIKTRVDIVRRRDTFDRDPAGFAGVWLAKDALIREQIVAARGRLANVDVPDKALERATTLCLEVGTDGLRGELTMIRAARALAALEGDREVGDQQLRAVAPMVLGHRLRRNPLDEASATVRVERAVSELFGHSGERHVV